MKLLKRVFGGARRRAEPLSRGGIAATGFLRAQEGRNPGERPSVLRRRLDHRFVSTLFWHHIGSRGSRIAANRKRGWRVFGRRAGRKVIAVAMISPAFPSWWHNRCAVCRATKIQPSPDVFTGNPASHWKRVLSPEIAKGKFPEIASAKDLLISIFEVRDAAECRAFGGIIRIGDKDVRISSGVALLPRSLATSGANLGSERRRRASGA